MPLVINRASSVVHYPLPVIQECSEGKDGSALSQPSITTDEEKVYSIVKIVGKGMGVVANSDISPGQLIMQEDPLLSVALTANGDLQGKVFLKTAITYNDQSALSRLVSFSIKF